jgi:hypothetical protein
MPATVASITSHVRALGPRIVTPAVGLIEEVLGGLGLRSGAGMGLAVRLLAKLCCE